MTTHETYRKSGLRSFAALLALALPACGLLDVDNPNSLLEEDVQQRTAANAVVNGALSTVSHAISRIWQPVLIAADELVWIGSRDAWLQLDRGFLSDPFNEFTDEHFPFLGRARWTADQAEEILARHVQEQATPAMRTDLARAHMFSGIMYMVLGEVQEDFVIASSKTEAGPPIGPANMHQMLDEAIAKFDRTVAIARELNNTNLETTALALRARARHSRAIWSKIKPNIAANPLVDAAGAVQDAQAVLARVQDDWTYRFTYTAATIPNNMADWVNSRGENQFDTLQIVNVDQANVRQIQSVRLRDPVENLADPVITAKLTEWKEGPITSTGNIYAPLTLASARLMHLILAEDALQKNNQELFRTHINRIRALDDLTPYTGQIPALDMLIHTRRTSLFLMGLRLNDMYRFGIRDPHWAPNSDAVQRPGTLLPITITERRANPHLQGAG